MALLQERVPAILVVAPLCPFAFLVDRFLTTQRPPFYVADVGSSSVSPPPRTCLTSPLSCCEVPTNPRNDSSIALLPGRRAFVFFAAKKNNG